MGRCTLSVKHPPFVLQNTYNSWIILSKLIIENKREAMAAPEMRARVMTLNRDAVFLTVVGDRSVGTG